MTAGVQGKLLIVDDEELHLRALCDTLQQVGYSTTGFTCPKDALVALRTREFDLLLTDLMMPEMDGISLLRAALEIDKNLAGIVMTGQGTIDTAVEAMKLGAVDYVLKPFKLSVVLPVISRALTVRRLRMENIQLLETVGIYELSMAIAFVFDPATIVRKMAEAAFQQYDVGSVSVLLPAPDGKELQVAVALGRNAETLQGQRIPVTDAMSEWMAHTEKLFAEPIPAVPDIGGGVSVPMLAAGRLMGILNFAPSRPHAAVPPGRIKMLNILASTAALALHAARLVEELRTAEERYRHLAENAPDIVFRYELAPQLHCTYMSSSVTALIGRTPEDFYTDPELILKVTHPEDRSLVEAVFHGQAQGKATTLRWHTRDQDTIWIEEHHTLTLDKNEKPIAIEGIARDITERKSLEEQLRHSQRMEGLGRLAGGVAHDFNNILTVIIGYSDFVLSELPKSNPYRQYLEQIKSAGDRAASLTRQLLAFGRKQVLQPRVLNINDAVGGCSKMLGRILGEDIDLVTVLDPTAKPVKADPGQLEQVLMNLAVNSRDAMPHGGKLTIETCNMTLDNTYAQAHVGVAPGFYVMLTVTDTGIGMDAETRSRIFEPFFTTKELGRGTGLGLSIVYGIVKQSGGNIWVYSEPEKGTTFKIYLPRVEAQIEAVESAESVKEIPTGSEVILIAEDEDAVREFTRMVLQGAGYKVFEAKDAQSALELFHEQKSEIGLVLTDLVMPGISGLALAEKLKEIQPSTKILYTSGYSDDVIFRHGHLDPGTPYIPKPYGESLLLQKVREILDRA